MKRNAPITLAHISALSATAFANPKASTATAAPAGDAPSAVTAPATDDAPSTAPTVTAPAKPRIAAVRNDVPMPTRIGSTRGSKSLFDFSTLTDVGNSLGVFDKTLKQMNSIIRNFNTKSDNRKAVTDSNGAPTYEMSDLKGPDGTVLNRIPDTSKPITKPIIELIAIATNPATDPDGAPIRVFRKA